MAGLATGILKNTTGTGAPSIAAAGDFPTLNQNTSGNAATATLATTANNIAGGSAGSVPYQTGSGATSLLDAGTAGYVLTSNGSSAPSWSPVSISSGTSGTLPVASGGSGASSFTAGILRSTGGTSAFSTISEPSGDIVGTSDSQTITNKTFGSGNTFSTAIPVSSGGTGKSTFSAGILKASGTSDFTTVTAPEGTIVGTSDSQTITNKTFGSGNTFSSAISVSSGGTGQSSFSAGILKASGTSNFTTVSAPSGAIVGTTDVQTLTNKTLGSETAIGTPVSGTLTNCTGLPLSTGITGTLQVANGGSGATAFSAGLLRTIGGSSAFSTITLPDGDVVGTTATQTLSNKTLTSPTFSTPTLGTPISGTLTNCTGLPLDAGTTGNLPASRVTGIATVPAAGVVTSNGTAFSSVSTLPVASGGTGQTSVVRGQIYKLSGFGTFNQGGGDTPFVIPFAGTLNTSVTSNMVLGATDTFSIKNDSGSTRIFRVEARVQVSSTGSDLIQMGLYSGVAGSLILIDDSMSAGYCFSTGTVTEHCVTLQTSSLISIPSSHEIAIYIVNLSSTSGDYSVARAFLSAEAIL